MLNMVAGLLFDDSRTKVVLLLKNHGPEIIVGKWNAPGGKIKPFETEHFAMEREFKEEAGVRVDWSKFLILIGNGFFLHFFHAFNTEQLLACRTMETEEVKIYSLNELPNLAPGLSWIIPMALSHMNDGVQIYKVTELLPVL